MIAKLKKIEMMTTMAHSQLVVGNIDTIVKNITIIEV